MTVFRFQIVVNERLIYEVEINPTEFEILKSMETRDAYALLFRKHEAACADGLGRECLKLLAMDGVKFELSKIL